MGTSRHDNTLWAENSLRWRVKTWKRGYKIVHRHSRLGKCLIFFVPIIMIMLIIGPPWKRMARPEFIMLIGALLLVGFWMSQYIPFLIDREREIPTVGSRRIPFTQLALFVYHEKGKNPYMLYAHDKRDRGHRMIWESTDKSEAIRVVEDIFGAVVEQEDIEGTGLFKYSHKTKSGVCINTLEKVEKASNKGLLSRLGRRLFHKRQGEIP